jgi:thioredoxin reductase (NADPH)
MPDAANPPKPAAHSPDAPIAEVLGVRPLLVVAFCAAWCNTCDEFGEGYAALAAARDDATFVWLDIEDDADVAGDVDIENFPTIAIYRDGRPIHFGVSLPQAALVGRLLDALGAQGRTVDAEEAVATLPTRLATWAAPRFARALRGRSHAARSASTN